MNAQLEIPMTQPTDCELVAQKLLDAGDRGITHKSFSSGFALRSRISDLRGKKAYLIQGYKIEMKLEKNPNKPRAKFGRYFLVKDGE